MQVERVNMCRVWGLESGVCSLNASTSSLGSDSICLHCRSLGALSRNVLGTPALGVEEQDESHVPSARSMHEALGFECPVGAARACACGHWGYLSGPITEDICSYMMTDTV